MSIHVDLHDFIEATAVVYDIKDAPLAGKWFCVIKLDNQLDLFTQNYATKVEALMGAFEYVDTLKAAVTKLADAEGMADFQASVDALPVELVADLSGPDGPVADSVDGYKVKEEV